MTLVPASVEVTKQQGKVVIRFLGRTGRGVKYIKAQKSLEVDKMSDKKFKAEMEAAVKELYGSEA